MNKVGIITYHSAYNYGSVLQAYATQVAVKKLGFDAEIINYRMREQKKIYALYRNGFGLKILLKDLMQIPIQGKRIQRIKKFESFINKKLFITKECSTPKEVQTIWEKYSIIISGSDQIWNKHSLEMDHNDINFMSPYLLKEYSGKKISYGSSIANMSDQELEMILLEIKKFDAISMREVESAKRMTKLLNREITAVVDPTFLLNKNEWINNMGLGEKKDKDKYILYYSLGGIKPLRENTTVLRKIANKKNLKIKVITPFAYLKLNDEMIEMHPDVGPEEFLELIYNANMIVTDSYHGTILAVNLNKEVYSLCENFGSEFRKTDILKRIGLDDRIIYDINSLHNEFKKIDYSRINSILESLRNDSYSYLKKALID